MKLFFLLVPGAPLMVVILDVGPTSVRVEWTHNTLPSDDGGSPLTKVRLSYRALTMEGVEEGVWQEAKKVNVGMGYHVIGTLMEQTTYQIRMQLENNVGKQIGFFNVEDPLPDLLMNWFIDVMTLYRFIFPQGMALLWFQSPLKHLGLASQGLRAM